MEKNGTELLVGRAEGCREGERTIEKEHRQKTRKQYVAVDGTGMRENWRKWRGIIGRESGGNVGRKNKREKWNRHKGKG